MEKLRFHKDFLESPWLESKMNYLPEHCALVLGEMIASSNKSGIVKHDSASLAVRLRLAAIDTEIALRLLEERDLLGFAGFRRDRGDQYMLWIVLPTYLRQTPGGGWALPSKNWLCREAGSGKI